MQSWVSGADDEGFGVDNLPIGVFTDGDRARPGVVIGRYVADLSRLIRDRFLAEESLLDATTLNAFLARGHAAWSTLREQLQTIFVLAAGRDVQARVHDALIPRSRVTAVLPIDVGDFVDFYSSIEHASNVGKLFRPDGEPLLPNYRHLPVGYHGRAGSVVVGGTPIRRPHGQTFRPGRPAPIFGPTRELDIELELGFVTGSGAGIGQPVAIGTAREHVYGFMLLNDWSARDIQAWEYQPLGPFLGKSFATSISPWIVSLDALEPARAPNRLQDPEPLPYLRSPERCAYDIDLEILLQSRRMSEQNVSAMCISRVNFRDMYWNFAQQLAHATVNGARLRPGDLFGSGTISGTEAQSYGSLLELTWRGERPIRLPTGEHRTFLDDGDTVIIRGCARAGKRKIAFGELSATVEA